MVATSHPDATKNALKIIEKGGNAFDLCNSVKLRNLRSYEAHSTGLGGDCFVFLFSERQGS